MVCAGEFIYNKEDIVGIYYDVMIDWRIVVDIIYGIVLGMVEVKVD